MISRMQFNFQCETIKFPRHILRPDMFSIVQSSWKSTVEMQKNPDNGGERNEGLFSQPPLLSKLLSVELFHLKCI